MQTIVRSFGGCGIKKKKKTIPTLFAALYSISEKLKISQGIGTDDSDADDDRSMPGPTAMRRIMVTWTVIMRWMLN